MADIKRCDRCGVTFEKSVQEKFRWAIVDTNHSHNGLYQVIGVDLCIKCHMALENWMNPETEVSGGDEIAPETNKDAEFMRDLINPRLNDLHINEMGLSIRLLNLIARRLKDGVHSKVRDLGEWSIKDIKKINGMGPVTFKELETKLKGEEAADEQSD